MCWETCFKYTETFFKTFKEYLQNSNVPGYGYFVERSDCERLLWALIHVAHLTAIIYLSFYVWNQFFSAPTITWQASNVYPIAFVPFPGISICSINRISLSRAQAFADKMSNISGVNSQEILENVNLLGKLYDYNLNSNDEAKVVRFQTFLENNDWDSDVEFNTHGLLKQLMTPCQDIISECMWKGISRNCQELFVTELTMDGHCCVFNYVTKKPTVLQPKILLDNKLKALSTGKPGIWGGLRVKIDFNESDYYYTTLSTTSAKVIISHPGDFPDTSSGGVVERLVPIGQITSLSLIPTTLVTSLEVKKYPILKRKCYFDDEQKTVFGSYSYSDCIMDCKIQSIVALCQCVPFQFKYVYRNDEISQCTLADLMCLNKYKEKWSTLYPSNNENTQWLEREKQDSLSCLDCIPACYDASYSVRIDVAPFFSGKSSFEENLTKNYSLLNIFYQNAHGKLLKQDVVFFWFEMIGIFGGICSLVMGISIISLIEFVYFITLKFYQNLAEYS